MTDFSATAASSSTTTSSRTFTRTSSLTTRLAGVVAAAVVTFVVFSSVDSISEPQRSVLVAKAHAAEVMAARRSTPTMAMADDMPLRPSAADRTLQHRFIR